MNLETAGRLVGQRVSSKVEQGGKSWGIGVPGEFYSGQPVHSGRPGVPEGC